MSVILTSDNIYAEKEGSNLFVFISNQYLQQDPVLTEKINRFIMDNCNFGVSYCRYGEVGCTSTSCFYVEESKMNIDNEETPLQGELEIIERLKISEILAYCNTIKIVKREDVTGEIYSVCSKKGERRGNARKLLTKVRDIYYNLKLVKRLWLAVDFYNPSWDSAIKLYTGLGFADPKVTKTASDGLELPSYDIVVMDSYNKTIYTKKDKYLSLEINFENPSTRTPEEVKNVCDRIRFVILSKYEDVYITLNIDILKYFIGKTKPEDVSVGDYKGEGVEVEYGGEIQVRIIDENLNIEGYGIDNIYQGKPGTIVVDIPIKPYTFHTHPTLIYTRAKNQITDIYVAWPSGQDMKTLVEGFNLVNNNMLVHFVATSEGIYTLQLSKEFMWFWTLLDDISCKRVFLELIFNRFTYLEVFRAEKFLQEFLKEFSQETVLEPNLITENLAEETFKKYMETANTYSIKQLVEDAANKIEELNKYILIKYQESRFEKNILKKRIIETQINKLEKEKRKFIGMDITSEEFIEGIKLCEQNVIKKSGISIDFKLFNVQFKNWKYIENNGYQVPIHVPHYFDKILN
jgi:hypothetical protein